MGYIIAITGSVTSASRLEKKLTKYGCTDVRVMHTPAVLTTGGCSYSVRISDKYINQLEIIMKDSRVKIKKLYREILVNGEVIYSDISG